MEDPPQKESSNAVSVNANTHMQPSSPLLGIGHSMGKLHLLPYRYGIANTTVQIAIKDVIG